MRYIEICNTVIYENTVVLYGEVPNKGILKCGYYNTVDGISNGWYILDIHSGENIPLTNTVIQTIIPFVNGETMVINQYKFENLPDYESMQGYDKQQYTAYINNSGYVVISIDDNDYICDVGILGAVYPLNRKLVIPQKIQDLYLGSNMRLYKKVESDFNVNSLFEEM